METKTQIIQEVFRQTKCNINELEALTLGHIGCIPQPFRKASAAYDVGLHSQKGHEVFRVLQVIGTIARTSRYEYMLTSLGNSVLNAVVARMEIVEAETPATPAPEPVVPPKVETLIKKSASGQSMVAVESDAAIMRREIGFDTTGVPIGAVKKALQVIQRLKNGEHWRHLSGKILKWHDEDVVSIPIGRKWRLMCRRTGRDGIVEPRLILSHEAYNRPGAKKNV